MPNEVINDPKPWDIKHDLPPKDAAAHIGVGLSKIYQMFATGEVESYHLGPDGRGGRRAVRESLVKCPQPRQITLTGFRTGNA